MRLHQFTRQAVNTIIEKHKPVKVDEDPEGLEFEDKELAQPEPESEGGHELYYYGIMMMNYTVVTIFKNNKDIAVTPTDINIMINYTQTNLRNRNKEQISFFREICLPGMTEEFKLPVLYTYSVKSDLKIIYVCEE